MANDAVPTPLTDDDLKTRLPLFATENKYRANYEKKRLPPNHSDTIYPAIHCLEHEIDHIGINPDSYPAEREAAYQRSTGGQYPQRHWFKPEIAGPRTRRGGFSPFPEGPYYTFQVFDSNPSGACVFEDKERDIKPNLFGRNKKTCIFMQEGNETVVQQPFLLRKRCYVSLKDACDQQTRNTVNIYLQQLYTALRAWKVRPDLKIAYGWHGKFLTLPKWDWMYVKQNWERRKPRTHRTKEER